MFKFCLLTSVFFQWTPQKPEGVSNLAKLFRILGKMACPKCGKETRFPQYYKFHEKWCGREVSTRLGWAGLGWAGLGWAGLGWAGLGWAGLGWAGLGWAGLQDQCKMVYCTVL